MKPIAAILLITSTVFAQEPARPLEIVTVFGDDLPAVESDQVLVQRHLYLACIDREAKQPVWVAYTVRKADWDSGNVLQRNFTTPKSLRPICLESGDFRNSGYEIGHLYALQLVSASEYAHEVNQMCAVAAQTKNLNRGPWLKAEYEIKRMSESEPVTVLAGQLFEKPLDPLPQADEPHRIASECFLIAKTAKQKIAWRIPQDCDVNAELGVFLVDPTTIKVNDQ